MPVDEKRVDPNPQTRLTGEDGCLDSLGSIDLITNTGKAASEESIAAITITNGKAMSAVQRAIEQLNQQLPVDEKRVDPNPQTRLTGEDGCLDSLGLIDLITNTEKAASEEFVAAITLAGKDAFDLSHFFTVQTLADYVAQRVREVLGEQAWA